MSSTLKYWKEAATLFLVAKRKSFTAIHPKSANFDILMLKRSGKSKFMPKLHVFPGGMSHDSDFSSEWIDLFKEGNIDVNGELKSFLLRGGEGTYMFRRPRLDHLSKIPSELAFRICAIRETFEESGILLVRDMNTVKNSNLSNENQPMSGKSSILSTSILKPWRDRVDSDAWQFLQMCRELKVLPDVWSLYEWSNWLTPILPGEKKGVQRRYDTAFYMCVLDYIPNAVHDDKETTELEWATAAKFLQNHSDLSSSLKLAPPQTFELARLLHFSDAEDLKRFSWERSAQRCTHWFSVVLFCDDGALFVHPGDDLYPEKPDLEGNNPIQVVKGTLVELRTKFPRMNRTEIIESDGKQIRNLLCNIKLPDGQVSPSTSSLDFEKNAKL